VQQNAKQQNPEKYHITIKINFQEALHQQNAIDVHDLCPRRHDVRNRKHHTKTTDMITAH